MAAQGLLSIVTGMLGNVKPAQPSPNPAPRYPASVLLDAGHGLYQLQDGTWNYQRDEWHGVLEDLAVQAIAASAAEHLRDVRQMLLARPIPGSACGDAIGKSGQARWKEAALYWVQDLLAGQPDVAKLVAPGNTDRAKDINCRPRYAGVTKADYLVSIHVNASDTNPAARGIAIYPKWECPASNHLAGVIYAALLDHPHYGNLDQQKRGVQCSEEFTRSKAILRDCPCPAVIVEFLFFTNEDDAAMLRSSELLAWAGQQIAAGIKAHLGVKTHFDVKG